MKFIQGPSPKLNNAANEYVRDKAYDSLKGLFGEDEVLKQTLEDEREDAWANVLPTLDTPDNQFMVERYGSITRYFDIKLPELKQGHIDLELNKQRKIERILRLAEIHKETEKNQLRDQIQIERYFEPINEELKEIDMDIDEVLKEERVYKQANSLSKENELRLEELKNKLEKDKRNVKSKFMLIN